MTNSEGDACRLGASSLEGQEAETSATNAKKSSCEERVQSTEAPAKRMKKNDKNKEKTKGKSEQRSTREAANFEKKKEEEVVEVPESYYFLWFGDIPKDLATRDTLKQLLAELELPTQEPIIKHVVAKGYTKKKIAEHGISTETTSDSAPHDRKGEAEQQQQEQEQQQQQQQQPKGTKEWLGYAFIAFASEAEARQAESLLQGRTIAQDRWKIRIRDAGDSWNAKPDASIADLAAGQQPALFHQLFPGSLKLAERRAAVRRHCEKLSFDSAILDEQPGTPTELMEKICKHYETNPREELPLQGYNLPPNLIADALAALRAAKWPDVSERRSVRAANYMVLWLKRRNEENEGLVQACEDIMKWADPAYPCTMVAITKNYIGSPHIDSSDVRHQFAVSLGDFQGGGELCVESMEDCSKVFVVETKNRIAWADGRAIHWVRGYSGERFSLIFYCTDPACSQPLEQSCDLSWHPAGQLNSSEE